MILCDRRVMREFCTTFYHSEHALATLEDVFGNRRNLSMVTNLSGSAAELD